MPAIRKLQPVFALIPWLFLLTLIPVYPQKTIEAAVRGVSIWWEVLFPALFPFFVVAELMVGLGVMHFIGSLLDPMMRPLFRVPGYGGFVMAMGFASGYPIGAKLTSQLCEQKLLNRSEGERLVSFTSTSDPIFLIGAVSVGFFHDAGLAAVLAAAHYGGGILVGLCMRYHDPAAPQTLPVAKPEQSSVRGSVFRRTFAAMHKARLDDGRPLGLMLQQAVTGGVRLVFVIGGLVVFFSVILELITAVGLMDRLYAAVARTFRLLHVPEPLSAAAASGIFEVTLGAKSAGEAPSDIPIIHKAAVAAFVLSWAGLSVHAQIVSLLTRTDLRYMPFLAARLMHGLFAFMLVYCLWQPLRPVREAMEWGWPALAGHASASFHMFGMFGMFGAPLSLLVFLSALLLIPILYVVIRGVPGAVRFLLRRIGAGG